MIILLNGAFGIGKTTVARLLVARMGGALLFDPEWIGIVLQRGARIVGRRVDDFQDLRAWRTLTIAGIRLARRIRPNVVVPMAFSNVAYLQEVRGGVERFDARVLHICLRAPLDVVHERLRRRGADPVRQAWEYRRAAECCALHGDAAFGLHLSADRAPDEIADEIADEIVRLLAAAAQPRRCDARPQKPPSRSGSFVAQRSLCDDSRRDPTFSCP